MYIIHNLGSLWPVFRYVSVVLAYSDLAYSTSKVEGTGKNVCTGGLTKIAEEDKKTVAKVIAYAWLKLFEILYN